MPTYQTERRWVVAIRSVQGDQWPDVKRTYNAVVFRPHLVTVTFSDKYDGGIGVEAAVAEGRRVFADRLGAAVSSERWCGEHGALGEHCPEWIVSLAGRALAGVLAIARETKDA